MKKETDISQYSTGTCRSVPSTNTSQYTKLPPIIEKRRLQNTKNASLSSTSENILKFMCACILVTMRIINDHILWNTRSTKRCSPNDSTTTDLSNELPVTRAQLDLLLSDDDDDDDDIDKRAFRQEMESLKIITHRKRINTKDVCRRSPRKHKCSCNCNRTHRNTMHHHYSPQNYRIADKILQRHFVHANFLQQIQQSISP